jgi:hypothetical protein
MNSNFDRTFRVLTVATAVAIALTAFAAHAQEATAEQRRACTPDAFRLCGSHIPNVAAITACMRANKSKLSLECKLVFDKPAKPRTAVATRDNYNRDQP